ncbi:MAG: hypothetical protein JXR84_27605, partial [Anaerolineae bacterium]|nr:hypothetical protein [Anaerolineae bacterium]
MRKRLAVIFVCIALSLLCGSAATASPEAQESIPDQGLSVSPRQLTVAAMQGQVETRVLLISTDQPIVDLHVVPLDLGGPNGDTVLPADAIVVDLPATTVPSGGLLTVPVDFNLVGMPSGQFSGELLITYDGQTLSVPVNVAVKDPPWLALVALVVGVGLGIGVSTYRSQGRPRDEVLVRLGQIRTQMKADADLQEAGKPFYNRIDAHLVDVEVALEAQQWEKAQQAVMKAENLWVRWRRGRPDWLVQLEYYETLNAKLNDLGDAFYVNEVKEAARSAYRAMPTQDDPSLFRASLEPLARQVNDFIALRERLTVLASTKTGRATAHTLQQRLYILDPANSAGFQSLKAEVETAIGKAYIAQIKEKTGHLVSLVASLQEADAQIWQPQVAALRARVAELAPDDSNAYLTMEGEVDAALDQVKLLVPSSTGDEALLRDAGATAFGTPKGLPQMESWL